MHWDCRASWPHWETGMYAYIVCAHIWMCSYCTFINMPNCTTATLRSTKCIKYFDFIVHEHVLYCIMIYSRFFKGLSRNWRWNLAVARNAVIQAIG